MPRSFTLGMVFALVLGAAGMCVGAYLALLACEAASSGTLSGPGGALASGVAAAALLVAGAVVVRRVVRRHRGR